jgi:hypothetical protein
MFSPVHSRCNVLYDDETGNYIYLDFIEETLHRTLEVSLDVSLRFDPADPQGSEVTEFIANDGDALWIYVEEDGWPYK